jgi:uncharacterized membrane protein (UPF0127 family)
VTVSSLASLSVGRNKGGDKRLALTLAAILIALSAQTIHAAEPAHLLGDFGRAQIIIEASSQRCIVVDVYIADTPQRRGNGLMFVESMDLYEGMLFIYPQPADISMWMKNTLIPLDMLFFDTELRIQHIHRNAVPLSEDIISSNGTVLGVIELNGGAAEHFGILPGDRISVPSTNATDAVGGHGL